MTKESSMIKRNPEGTRRRILDAATEEFRLGGYAGARVDCIAKRAETNERMLYYYFGSKKKLFIAALEHTYDAFIAAQSALQLAGVPPEEAIVLYIRFIWDYYAAHPEMIRLVNNENLHHAEHLRESTIRTSFMPVIGVLEDILMRGAASGVFRAQVDPLRFYLTISALGYYVLSNRYTLAETFGRDFMQPDERALVQLAHTEMLLGYLRSAVGNSTGP